MLAKDLISENIPVLKPSDTGVHALSLMDVFRVSHLPIVNDKEFLGLISDTDIAEFNNAGETIGNHKLSLLRPYVMHDQHIYEVIEICSRLRLTVVPVLNGKNEFMGVITQNGLMYQVANLMAVSHKGGIIVLELNMNDYSLTEIANIVESNDAKILSLYIKSPADSTKIEITIKTNRIDMSALVQTFERYNYNIKYMFLHNSEIDVMYNDRLEEFLRYLEV
ncbi:MAG: CBS domain-containing protein [Bacteroidia bacterium]|nr:CBS domain-containing protein [Bacteroidia bacterium]